MTSDWHQALQDLESATGALDSINLDGAFETALRILARRRQALNIVQRFCEDGLCGVPEPERAEFRARLDRVRQSGDLAAARLLAQQQQASREWNHLRLLARALCDPTRSTPRVNCKG